MERHTKNTRNKRVQMLAICVVALILLALNTTSIFADDKTYGKVLFDLGVIKGDGNGLNEDGTLTREEMVTILDRLGFSSSEYDNFKAPETQSFLDISSGHWAYKNVEFALAKSITKGIDEKNFGLGTKVNGNQAAMFLARIAGYDCADISGTEIKYETAYEQISNLLGIKSQSVSEPDKPLLRSEVFEMIYRTLQVKRP